VHKELGPGLLESVYHKCLKHEFLLQGINLESEFRVSVHYKGYDLDTELRCDFVIENAIVVELKAVDSIVPVYAAKLITYMQLLHKPKGILINFDCTNIFKEGQKKYINELFKNLTKE
jgi:GxxExxY protein